MKLDEMKLAICQKLSEKEGTLYSNDSDEILFDLDDIDWPTEGLQVCHEAEKLLTPEQQDRYYANLCEAGTWFDCLHTTYEQRLVALCLTLWPERFSQFQPSTNTNL